LARNSGDGTKRTWCDLYRTVSAMLGGSSSGDCNSDNGEIVPGDVLVRGDRLGMQYRVVGCQMDLIPDGVLADNVYARCRWIGTAHDVFVVAMRNRALPEPSV
jgi:hypothetical protein